MPLLETDYCAEQINVPPKLPVILKQFCKSAIRTQPYDLLKWSSAYFHALANGEEPPAKLRLEYPPACSPYGLTFGFLKVLLRQLGADYNKVLPLECILRRWDYLCLDRRDADLIMTIGNFRKKCQIKKFLAIAVGLLTRTITETMIMVCELFTHEPDGGSAMISIGLFMEIYGYLAGLRCDGAEKGSTENLCLCSERSGTSESVTELPQEAAAPLTPATETKTATEHVTIAPEDTQADIHQLEQDFTLKDDIPSSMAFQSFGEETGESYMHEGEASFLWSDRTHSSSQHSEKEASYDSEADLKRDVSLTADVPPAEPQEEVSQTESTSEVSKQSGEEAEKTVCSSSDTCAYYPDVPGIGRRLTAEEIATVAIWLSDCARRQGGMVGPRNIRHVNCPPLEGKCCTTALACDDLLIEKFFKKQT